MNRWQRIKNNKRKQKEKEVQQHWNSFIDNLEKNFGIKLHWFQKQILKTLTVGKFLINNYKRLR